MTKLTHFDQNGQAHMVDIATKEISKRSAIATGKIYMQSTTYSLVQNKNNKKGDVLAVARIAAISGAKYTAHLIPLCHPLALTHINVDFELNSAKNYVQIKVTAETLGRTGVEMEALTAANIGLLTIYDMLKATDKGMQISDIKLLAKYGGKSGDFINNS